MKKILFSVFILVLDMISLCIAEGIDVFWLSQKGTPAQLKEALDNGANFNISRRVDEVADTDIHDLLFDSGETPLHHAASYNRNPESIKFLISLGLDVNAMAGSGQSVIETPLSCAIRNKNIEAAKELLKAGANPNSYSSQGYSSAGSPLDIVAIEYNGDYKLAKDIIEALIQAGGYINNHSELTAEDIASLNEYEEEFAKYKAIFLPMNQWKSNNPFDNIRDFSSSATSNLLGTLTPLMYAVLCGNYDVVDILLDAGANADIRSSENKTALDYANGLSNNSRFHRSDILKKIKAATTGSTINTNVGTCASIQEITGRE